MLTHRQVIRGNPLLALDQLDAVVRDGQVLLVGVGDAGGNGVESEIGCRLG